MQFAQGHQFPLLMPSVPAWIVIGATNIPVSTRCRSRSRSRRRFTKVTHAALISKSRVSILLNPDVCLLSRNQNICHVSHTYCPRLLVHAACVVALGRVSAIGVTRNVSHMAYSKQEISCISFYDVVEGRLK